MSPEPRTYLIVVSIHKTASLAELADAFSGIKVVIERLSNKDYLLAFRSKDTSLAGFFANSQKSAREIRMALEGSTESVSDDAFLILEVGETYTGSGHVFTGGWNWLQHHQVRQS
ncbi:hypothetical protein [Oceanibacterium hippocampi]|uniref:hypothetical protein n=1 Tax=Oceanibacterium hippocampi TaxID=745714 RepID=UPI00111C5D04|nr:hypothetical protein [Oceanibacterium hippocampi]